MALNIFYIEIKRERGYFYARREMENECIYILQ